MELLVEQLQNQDPLDPTDTTEFTNQIMSYASYGQQVETNEALSSLADSIGAIQDTLTELATALGVAA